MKTKSLKLLCAIFCVILIVLSVTSCVIDSSYSDYDLKQAIDKQNATGTGEYILVSFPGLGIGASMINSEAIRIGGVTVYWYGILITLGIVLAFLYSYFVSKREGIKVDDLLDMGIWAVICAVVGARLYYVLTSLDKYKDRFWDVFKIWEGGIAIYGAIIGGAAAIAIVCLIKKIKILKAYDTIAPAVMIGQIIGRWGNFMNGEAFGYELRDGDPLYFIRMGVYSDATRQLGKSGIIYVHPTFLYESLWNLIGFVLINVFFVRKKKFDGQVFFAYIAWYGFGRTFIELLRQDSLYLTGTIRISSLVGALCFFAGTAMFIWFSIRGKKARLATESYESVYPLFRTASSTTEEIDGAEAQKTEETEEEKVEEEKNDEVD
ncbi:MAG: prolipoprotein diacylglyceryl transferase [Clostridia bacterium]|nr:prolipoprotein diacylglyceryl transferase [Clostridia bacterium]